MFEKEILNMPKIDLHCHLDGSMTQKGIEKILEREVGISELQVSSECRSLAEYLEKFDLPLECIQTPEGLKESSKEFLLNLQGDNVKYVEVRFAPQLSTTRGMNCTTVMEAVLEGLKAAKEQCGIYYQVIACMMRHHSEETNLSMLKECREFLGEGLCAVDLAGDEAGFPTRNFYELFQCAKKLDYPNGSEENRSRHCHERNSGSAEGTGEKTYRRRNVSYQQLPDKGASSGRSLSDSRVCKCRRAGDCQYRQSHGQQYQSGKRDEVSLGTVWNFGRRAVSVSEKCAGSCFL